MLKKIAFFLSPHKQWAKKYIEQQYKRTGIRISMRELKRRALVDYLQRNYEPNNG
jgi:hypothetical protein